MEKLAKNIVFAILDAFLSIAIAVEPVSDFLIKIILPFLAVAALAAALAFCSFYILVALSG